MARFQVRTGADQVIEDVIDLMASRAKEILEAWNVFQTDLSDKNYITFKNAIHNNLKPYVKSYKLCGVSSICLDHSRNTELSPPTHVLDANPDDTVYQFFPRKDLDTFLENLAICGRDSLQRFLKPGTDEGVLSTLRVVFRCVLGDYLYFNPLCGNTDLCKCSVMAKEEPWWHKSDHAQ
jgi:hypothetical protein